MKSNGMYKRCEVVTCNIENVRKGLIVSFSMVKVNHFGSHKKEYVHTHCNINVTYTFIYKIRITQQNNER